MHGDVELEPITEIDMYLMIEKGIYGSIWEYINDLSYVMSMMRVSLWIPCFILRQTRFIQESCVSL